MSDKDTSSGWNFKVEELNENKKDISSFKSRLNTRYKKKPELKLELERQVVDSEKKEKLKQKNSVHRVYSTTDVSDHRLEFKKHSKAEIKKRVLANLIDILILSACGFALHLCLTFFAPDILTQAINNFSYFELAVDSLFVYLIIIRQLQVHSSTIGKRFFHLEVITSQGPYLSFGECFMREIVGKLVLSALLPITILLILFQKEGRSVHDFIAGTMVIDTE